ncbi:MAG: hypothetical protein A2233_02665 [Candidatus Kerfeldbacteria bacterium RIFOXYA2_FULL_38_24]|uniref:Uncharacterized protein n=1 Tax=Candidatus Kerfeldbacteria bacterium RIFOXYB2_FULL_38_14 TaxID=1798547 RepID=A0A1G2BGJ1_9BACT|nr:MAG: hypothetical protein A2233_02665 [Candidatus Kerfeldbacteria bacterium RIFOXYA2_FULL_38_24]OGY88333.1 MAG: hypothetical protein A2319_03375 [Candidatus Kerfeldbacteria bacterium RIFOXYB2_FULL_38_14]
MAISQGEVSRITGLIRVAKTSQEIGGFSANLKIIQKKLDLVPKNRKFSGEATIILQIAQRIFYQKETEHAFSLLNDVERKIDRLQDCYHG